LRDGGGEGGRAGWGRVGGRERWESGVGGWGSGAGGWGREGRGR